MKLFSNETYPDQAKCCAQSCEVLRNQSLFGSLKIRERLRPMNGSFLRSSRTVRRRAAQASERVWGAAKCLNNARRKTRGCQTHRIFFIWPKKRRLFPSVMEDLKEWPAFNVERRSIADLKPYANNARTHSKEQINQIVASMREWGFTNPVLVDEAGMIIAGHGRVQAAKLLGVSEIPTIVARGWSEAQKRAYVLADNQLALNSGWDENLLRLEIGAIKGLDFDIGTIGFGDEFLSGLFATKEGKTDPDDVPEPPANPVTTLGDVCLLANTGSQEGPSLLGTSAS